MRWGRLIASIAEIGRALAGSTGTKACRCIAAKRDEWPAGRYAPPGRWHVGDKATGISDLHGAVAVKEEAGGPSPCSSERASQEPDPKPRFDGSISRKRAMAPSVGAPAPPAYKLHYFHLAGLGEPIRYLLHYGGIPFEDIRIGAQEWPEHKKKMPFGTMPVLEADGVMFTQSRAICRFLAGKVGLSGDTPEECLQIDIVVDAFNDLRAAVADWFYDGNKDTKMLKLTPLLRQTAPFYLNKFEAMAKANGGYLANGKLSWADVYFCAPMTWFDAMLRQDTLGGYPTLEALRRRVDSLPGVEAYVKARQNAEKLCPRFIGP